MKRSYLAAVAAASVVAGSALADTQTLSYSIIASGSTPGGAAPYLTATFTDVANGDVQLTLNATGLVGTEFVTTWAFNVTSTIDPSDLSFLETGRSGYSGSTLPQAVNQNDQNGGPGGASMRFDFNMNLDNSPPGDRFSVGDSITYVISAPVNLSIYDFLVGASASPVISRAHIQGINTPSVQGGSAWVQPSYDANNIPPIPEPSTYAAGVAIAAMGYGAWRRARRKA
jgi:hypothetical protein